MERLTVYKSKRLVDSTLLTMALRIKVMGLEDITFVTILKGGLYVSSAILRNLSLSESTIMACLGLSSYKGGTVSTNEFKVTYDSDLTDEILKDRNVWIIDDICDSGKTLDRAKGMIQVYQPKSIHTAVLVDKVCSREVNHFPTPDVVGFSLLEDKFLVGCGMGYGEKYRSSKELYSLDFVEEL